MSSAPHRVFVAVRGQDDNLGDSVLRRPLLQMLHREGFEAHVLTGSNSPDYLESVGVRSTDVVYRDPGAWSHALVRSLGRPGRCSVLLNAGEVRAEREQSYIGWKLLLRLALVRARGGQVVQTGTGVRRAEGSPPPAAALMLRRMALVTWRDPASAEFFGVGEVHPDWALSRDARSSGHDATDPGSAAASQRRLLTVSLRFDREFPSPDWLAAVRRVADERGLVIRLVAQVRRDSARAVELATALASDEPVGVWDEGETHLQREEALRAVYRESSVVVSDRLHVLLLAATEGAVPWGLAPQNAEKLVRTLAPVRLDQLCGTVADLPRLRSALDAALGEPDFVPSRMQAAEDELLTLSATMADRLRTGPHRRRVG